MHSPLELQFILAAETAPVLSVPPAAPPALQLTHLELILFETRATFTPARKFSKSEFEISALHIQNSTFETQAAKFLSFWKDQEQPLSL